jgi:hypothetical protein
MLSQLGHRQVVDRYPVSHVRVLLDPEQHLLVTQILVVAYASLVDCCRDFVAAKTQSEWLHKQS